MVNFKNAICTLEERYAIKFCFKHEKMPCDESWIYCYDPETKRQSFHWKHVGSLRPKMARQSKSTHKLLMIPFFFWQHWHDQPALGSPWTNSQQGILCWGFKIVQEEILSEEASTLPIGSVAFHQDDAPVHNSILVTDFLTKMDIKTVLHPPYILDLWFLH